MDGSAELGVFLAIRDQREGSSGARGKTGTRGFMAIGMLHDNEKHSFMHGLDALVSVRATRSGWVRVEDV